MTGMNNLTALAFFLPAVGALPVGTHPDTAAVERESAAWTRHHLGRLYPDPAAVEAFLRARYGLWACLCYPHGARDRVRDIADLGQLLTVLDDAYSDPDAAGRDPAAARHTTEKVLAVLGSPERDAAESPLELALRDVWSRISTRMRPGPRERYLAATARYLAAWTREVEDRRTGRLPGLDAYLRARRDSVTGRACLIHAEYVLDLDLSAELADPLFTPVHEAVLDHLTLVNDLFSFRKEHYGAEGAGALHLLLAAGSAPLQQAVDQVCARITAAERAFTAGCDRLLTGRFAADPRVHAYLTELGHLCSGSLRFSRITERYHGPGHRWNGSVSGPVRLSRERTVFG